MKDSLVAISESAFFSIVTSALEAYKLKHSMDNGERSSCVETFGHLWGYESSDHYQLKTVYSVVWADTSTAVDRNRESVISQDEAYELKSEFVDSFFPQLTYLGDFHSHPYDIDLDKIKTELELERRELYRFSPADFRSVKYLQDEKKANYRVGIVVTVYERSETRKRSSKHLDDRSCIRFQYSGATIWIKAYVWKGDIYDGFRRQPDKRVQLICQAMGMHAFD